MGVLREYAVTKRRLRVKRSELQPLLATINKDLTNPPVFILLKQTEILKDYKATVPIDHYLKDDAIAFISAVRSSTTAQIEK